MIGEYVRLIIARKTHRGTITARRKELGHIEYLFHHDERFENRVRDFWVLETEVEMCPRPTDTEVKVINMLVKQGH